MMEDEGEEEEEVVVATGAVHKDCRQHEDCYNPDSHTHRLKNHRDKFTPQIRCDAKIEQLSAHTLVKYTTDIDDEGFSFDSVRKFGHCTGLQTTDVCFYHNAGFDTLISRLEEKSLKTQHFNNNRIECCYSDNRQTAVYALPVTGSVFVTLSAEAVRLQRESEKQRRYLIFNNKKYDTRVLYFSNKKYEFQKYGEFAKVDLDRLHLAEVTTAAKIKIKGKGFSNHNDVDVRFFDRRNNVMRGNYRLQTDYGGGAEPPPFTGSITHYDIDFAEDVTLTHMSTVGRVHLVSMFPASREEAKEVGLLPDNNNKHIFFVQERRPQGYVTKLKVLVRRHSDKTWLSLGCFTGNTDRFTEVLIAFPQALRCRYVRIIPQSFNGSPSMQLSFFSPTGANTAAAVAVAKDNHASDETVTYTLHLPRSQPYLTKWRSYGDDYGRGTLNHNVKRKQVRSLCSQLVKVKDNVEMDVCFSDDDDVEEEEEEEEEATVDGDVHDGDNDDGSWLVQGSNSKEDKWGNDDDDWAII